LLSQVHPLLHFDATSASLPSGYCFPTGVQCRHKPPSKSTSLELLDPSACTDPKALLATSDSEGVWKTLPCFPEVPPPGFGYPLDGFSRLRSLKASFSSQRSWASLFRAFLLPSDRIAVSRNSLRSCAFLPNLPAWYRRSSGLLPPGKPCPLLASRRISPGRNTLALLRLLAS
jgi:hypothetical protein